MATEQHLRTTTSKEYELVDSGNHAKLERFGNTLVSRPDTQAVWQPHAPEKWSEASATFSWTGGKGAWTVSKDIPEPWVVHFDDLALTAKLTSFKHTGIFPEQEPNWNWTTERIEALTKPKVLNLFGYTGGASIKAALAGAEVTHVDYMGKRKRRAFRACSRRYSIHR
jgi:23S rRNA (cytosine1962-C5)-methyltransferase